ncbi:MAG: septation protein SpoVG family protein [Clostridiales bacterium]|nr:septation protein SpoVG family protein [Clostridiales bacterium]
MLEITDIRVRKIYKEEGKVKAKVSVTFNNCLVIHEIKIINNGVRIFVSMPNKKTSLGDFKDIAHPINFEMRQYIENEILKKYYLVISEQNIFSNVV